MSAFTLEAGRWYAMTMYPGYGDTPHRSPIQVQSARPLGQRKLEVAFLNVGYAAGVQDMTKILRTLQRYPGALITQEEAQKDRTTIFEPLTLAWVSAFTPLFGEMLIRQLGHNSLSG